MVLHVHLYQVAVVHVKGIMPRAYSYIVARDYGFAPNPFYAILTLATCKPMIRKTAKVGDFIIGCSNKANGNKLIYMAKVSEILTFDQYWNDPRFAKKKPIMNGSLKKLYGDNIYHHDDNGNWIQEDSHHTHDDGTTNKDNLERDTKHTDKVLICDEFFYLGKSMITLSAEYDCCICKGRNYCHLSYDDAKRLWDYLRYLHPEGGKIDQPNQFINFKRYDGVS